MSTCSLCKQKIHTSGNVRPNVATFECGHSFHLNCTIKFCKERFTDSCPSCEKSHLEFLPNFGSDRMIAMETLINARRGNRELKPSDEHLLGKIGSWFNQKSSLLSLVENGISLSQCKLQGYLPEDFIEHSITWKKCVKTYTTPALLEFGFRWHHMIQMGFTPDDFKRFDWEELTNTLNVESKDMMKTSITIEQLAELKYPAHYLKQLGFSWKDLVDIGGNAKTMVLITKSLQDLKTYFNPSPKEWEDAGFTKERIKLYGWNTSDYTPVRTSRVFNVANTMNKIQF